MADKPRSVKPDFRAAHAHATTALDRLSEAIGGMWFDDGDPLHPRVRLEQARDSITLSIEALGGEEAGRDAR